MIELKASTRLAGSGDRCRRLDRHILRDESGELIVGLGQVNDVCLALQQRGHRRTQLASVDRLARVEPPDIAAEVRVRRAPTRRSTRVPVTSPRIHTAVHGRQHQVARAHPAQEPVELLKPLPTVGIRLVLVPGLHRLLQLVVADTGIEVAELRSAERDEPFAQPVGHEVVAVDVRPTDHPGPLRGLLALSSSLRAGLKKLLQRSAVRR